MRPLFKLPVAVYRTHPVIEWQFAIAVELGRPRFHTRHALQDEVLAVEKPHAEPRELRVGHMAHILFVHAIPIKNSHGLPSFLKWAQAHTLKSCASYRRNQAEITVLLQARGPALLR